MQAQALAINSISEVMKQELVQSVVHDLRAPMTVIKGYMQLLLSGMMGTMSPAQLDVLQKSVGPLEEMILMTDNLLQSTNLQKEAMELHPETIDLDKMLSETIDFYQLPFQQRQMQLYRNGNTLGINLNADPFWLKRVMNNLIWNAFKFTPDGGEVFLEVEQHRDGSLEIHVQDTGRGIPADKLNTVFEKFKQANPVQDAKIGSGLGLWICKRVMELHDGHITVTSIEGQGTRFSLWLPPKNIL